VRELRTLEARGEVRGGRFVAGFDDEQYALPEAVTLLRAVRKRGRRVLVSTSRSPVIGGPKKAGRVISPSRESDSMSSRREAS
jgi:hypothetical protein